MRVSRRPTAPDADAAQVTQDHPPTMRKTYAVWWQEEQGRRHAGKLEVGYLHLLLAANASERLAIPLTEIVAVEYARGELTITRRHDTTVRIGNLDGPGVLLELSDTLAA